MATATVDTLITKYVLDDSSYRAGTMRVVSDTYKIDQAQKKVKQSTSDMNKGFSEFFSAIKLGGTIATAFTATMVAIGSAILAASWAAANKAAEFEALENGLKAVSESAAEARKNLADLKDIAKLPGVDIEGAVQGFSKLRFAGLGADMSKEIIRQAGNANAIAGGGRQEFESILRAFSQIASTEFLKGQELLQLSDAGLPAVSWIKNAFGTADTEKLKQAGIDSKMVLEALTIEMGNLARASGGAKNELENLQIAIDQAQVGFGKGIIDGVFGGIEALTQSLEDLTDSGVFRYFGETIALDIQSALGIVDTNDLREMFIKMGASVVELAAHVRNFVINVREGAKYLDPTFIFSGGLASSGDIAKLIGKASSSIDPAAEASRFEAGAMAMLKASDDAAVKRKAEREKEESERRARLDAQRSDFEQRKGEARARLDALNSDGDKPTKEIASNTRRAAVAAEKLLDSYNSTVFGGSELGKMGLSAREIKSIRSNSGDKIAQAVDLIKEAMGEMTRGSIAAQRQYAR